MEKFLLPVSLAIIILSTLIVTAIGEAGTEKMIRDGACVESRSCAIRYMNQLEQKEE